MSSASFLKNSMSCLTTRIPAKVSQYEMGASAHPALTDKFTAAFFKRKIPTVELKDSRATASAAHIWRWQKMAVIRNTEAGVPDG
jgi:hypothetical protein